MRLRDPGLGTLPTRLVLHNPHVRAAWRTQDTAVSKGWCQQLPCMPSLRGHGRPQTSGPGSAGALRPLGPCLPLAPCAAAEEVTPPEIDVMYSLYGVAMEYPEELRQRMLAKHGHEPACVVGIGRRGF